MKCKIIIVTHNNEKHLPWLIEGLESSKSNIEISIVDSGSTNTLYLDEVITKHEIKFYKKTNIGFVKGNNLALEDISETDWVLFLNPDARIEGSDLDEILKFAEDNRDKKYGVIGAPLLRFDIDTKTATGEFDSLGIHCNSYGKWLDVRNEGPGYLKNRDKKAIPVDAICGAFMLISKELLQKCKDKNGVIGFESSYHMYKEDIELSLRIKKAGYTNVLYSGINVFHCRGWNKKRKAVPHWAKLNSAKNDIDIALRYKNRAIPYSLLKYVWVKTFERI